MAGSRFVAADLHVHTMLGPGEATKRDEAVTCGRSAAATRSEYRGHRHRGPQHSGEHRCSHRASGTRPAGGARNRSVHE